MPVDKTDQRRIGCVKDLWQKSDPRNTLFVFSCHKDVYQSQNQDKHSAYPSLPEFPVFFVVTGFGFETDDLSSDRDSHADEGMEQYQNQHRASQNSDDTIANTKKIEAAKDRSRSERLRLLMHAFKQAQREEQTPRSKEQEMKATFERLYLEKIRLLEERNATLNRRSTAYRSFIIDKGLSEDFNREYHRQKEVERPEKNHEREFPSTN